MPRVKRAVQAKKKRTKTLQQTKGFRWGRKNKYRLAKDALRHALSYAYRDRRRKKRDFRRLWQIKIGALSRANGLSYSKFINGLKETGTELDRKILADFGQNHPAIFIKVVELVKQGAEKPAMKKELAKTVKKATVKKPAVKKAAFKKTAAKKAPAKK